MSIEPYGRAGPEPYSTSGPLPSEQVVLSAPMSFNGSTRRLYRKLHPRVAASYGWRKAGWVTLLAVVLLFAWIAIFLWYCLFGLWLVPYRIVRRVQRHGERNRLRHQETIAAIERRHTQP
jgi:hypothetical protein